jgi:hypothetical protein
MHVFAVRPNTLKSPTCQVKPKLHTTQSPQKAASSHTAAAAAPSFNFSSISVYPASSADAHPALAMAPPGDVYEREAERVSDQVVKLSEPGPDTRTRISRIPANPVQRMCVQCEEQEKKDGKGGTPGEEIDGHTAAAIQALSGQGASLPRSERSFFEPRFGHDFSEVRVHTDSRAADLARNLGARAFTVGQDIVFGSGEYAPGSSEGRQVLAHELVHTVQQGTAANRIQRLTISQYSLTKGTCGERNVQWVFSLDKPALADGYIVQHIQRGAFINKCPPVAGPPNIDLSFWEAWKLKKGETVDWTTTRDKWTDGNTRPPNPGTAGVDFANGEVKFFKQSITGDLGDFGAPSSDPKSAWGPGKVPASGALPSTGSEPSWWSGAPDEGPAKRSVWADWNCCDADPKKQSYNLTATPTPAKKP